METAVLTENKKTVRPAVQFTPRQKLSSLNISLILVYSSFLSNGQLGLFLRREWNGWRVKLIIHLHQVDFTLTPQIRFRNMIRRQSLNLTFYHLIRLCLRTFMWLEMCAGKEWSLVLGTVYYSCCIYFSLMEQIWYTKWWGEYLKQREKK
jgi:hypothetical protein